MSGRLELRLAGLSVALLALVLSTGCTHLAEDIANHLAEHDVQVIQKDIHVVEGDLRLFRKCLEKRGGTCRGSASTPLPHSSQHHESKAIASTRPGGSTSLASSLAALPAGHPAKIAHEVLSHPVTRQATALHDHLRGLGGGEAPGFSTPGLSVQKGKDENGQPESTVTMHMKLHQAEDFHGRLLSSLGSRAWDSLDHHCRRHLETHRQAGGSDQAESDQEEKNKADADCRRAAFVRGYLGAYLRHGEFVEVDVELAGLISGIDKDATELERDIDSLRERLETLESTTDATEKSLVKDLGDDSKDVVTRIEALSEKVDQAVSKGLGKVGAAVAADMVELLGQAEVSSERLLHLAESDAAGDIRTVAKELDGILQKIISALTRLRADVQGLDMRLVGDIHDELDKADSALSNVFKVSKVGFVSRDSTFNARLPTLEVTLDPTVEHLVTLTDADTGQVLTTRSDFRDLGVATDTSGVGTGASIGAELVRIFLEAIFDAHEGLPAIAPANLHGARPTGLMLGAYSLPVFRSPTGNIDHHDLTLMTDYNQAAALETRLIVGRIISGLGPFSLDNPPLESLITEIVATSVRKAVAKASWCWYACNLDVEVAKAASDVEKALEDKLKEEEMKLEAGERKAASWIDREAETVKLRLRLGN